MGNLITEKMRNPQDDSWIPLRKICEIEEGKRVVKYLDLDTEQPLNIADPLFVEDGQLKSQTPSVALNNLGITWGTEEAPVTGTPGSIYIQIN